MVYAIIAAGGLGTRFGADKPKQLVDIGGQSILRKTVSIFADMDIIAKTVVVCPKDWIKECENELTGLENICVIQGGQTRNETVMRALDFIIENYGTDENTIVVTHDAVRPFVTQKIISDSIDAAKKYGASVAAVPCIDTVIQAQDGFIQAVPDRSRMFCVQTPQTFLAEKLRRLYSELSEKEKEILTDCSGIFVLRGEKVALVDGAIENIKITYKSQS